MAMEHRTAALYGVQFHPEAILTQGGLQLVANFLRLAKIDGDRTQLSNNQWLPPVEPLYEPPERPVTF
jgi:hypothetical protein